LSGRTDGLSFDAKRKHAKGRAARAKSGLISFGMEWSMRALQRTRPREWGD
jgi:hypothetical protein